MQTIPSTSLAYVRLTFILGMALSPVCAVCQQQIIDSLTKELTRYAIGDTNYINILLRIGEASYSTDPEQTYKYALQTKSLSYQSGYLKGLASAYSLLGISFAVQSKSDSAQYYFLKNLQIADSLQDQRLIAIANRNIGGIHTLSQDYKLALPHIRKALEIQEKLNYPLDAGNSYLALGICYNALDKKDSAKTCFEKALEIFLSVKAQKRISETYSYLGDWYLQEGNTKEAFSNFEKSLAISISIGDSLEIVNSHLNIANTYTQKSDYTTANMYLDRAFSFLKRLNLPKEYAEYYALKAENFEKWSRFDSALYYSKLYFAFKEKSFDEEKYKALHELEVKYETQKKAKENLILSKENTLIRIRQGITLGIVFILIGFIMLGTYLYYKQSNIKFKLEAQNQTISLQNEQLVEVNASLNQANATKNRLFAIIAHDIRGPIIALQGLSKKFEYLLNTGQHERLGNLSAMVDHSVKEVSELLDNLLRWALIQGERLRMNPVNIHVMQVMDEVTNIFQYLSSIKSIQLISEIPGDLVIFADQGAFSIIMRNLVQNAIKYSGPHSTVRIVARAEQNRALIEVSDQGPGISREKLEEVFSQNLENVVNNKSIHSLDTGLGLVLTKQMTEMNQGSIDVFSEAGKGTTFILAFPLVKQNKSFFELENKST